MSVASLELCRELYQLSGWDGTHFLYTKSGKVSTIASMFSYKPLPAYDLGYLLRKLPPELSDEDSRVYLSMNISMTQNWCARYADAAGNRMNIEKFYAPTPEDAACKMAIKLFKQGILAPTQLNPKDGE